MPRVADDTPLSDVVVDDAETDRIQYIPGPSTTESDGRWSQNSGVREDFYYRGTVSYCNVKGCRLEFPFKGTAIAAYGVTSTTDNTTSWWQVDNGKIYVFEPDREGLDRTYHLRLYQSEELPFGEHTLYANVTYLQRGSFALDWLEYNATSTSPTSSSTSLIPPSATSTSSRSTSPTTALPDSSSESRNSGLSFSTKATIAGGVVGGVLIPALLYWLYRVWRRRRSQGHVRRLDNRPDSPPPPFSSLYDTDADEEGRSSHHSHYSSDMGLSATMSERQPMLSSGQPAGEATTQSVYHPGRDSHLDDHASPTEDGPSHNVSDKARRSTEPRRDDGSMEELPPAYSP